MSNFTHYVVVDSDDRETVLAWFPITEADARERACFMGRDTLQYMAKAIYNDGFEIVGTPWLP